MPKNAVSRPQDEGGFTLVEVVVAILIIGIALIPVMNMFNTGLKTTRRAARSTSGTALAQGVMEEVLTLPRTSLASIPRQAYAGYPFQYKVNVSVYGPSAKQLKQVVVTFYPDDGTKETALLTVVSRR